MTAGNADTVPSPSWRIPAWDAIPDLVYGFLGRAHALPAGPFTLAQLRAVLGSSGEPPMTVLAVRQVHGTTIVSPETGAAAAVTDPEAASLPDCLPDGDALVSASADIVLTIRTADCVPILLVAPRARAVAAVHAGWQGTLAGVTARALTALEHRYGAQPQEVLAAIGPAIGACCYEFGAEHFARFVAAFGSLAERAWRASESATRPPGERRGHLDLRLLNQLVLESAGLPASAIHVVGPCTVEHPEVLHSYRRDGPRAGRQISYVGWRS